MCVYVSMQTGSPHSQWWLDRVEVTNPATGVMTTFPCNKWIEPQVGCYILTHTHTHT